MNRPSRGERESAATMRYCGCLVLPTRVRRSFTAMGREPSSTLTTSAGAGTDPARLAGEPWHPAARGAAAGQLGEVGEAARRHPRHRASALALLALADAGHAEALHHLLHLAELLD